jgi:hypothetical protein
MNQVAIQFTFTPDDLAKLHIVGIRMPNWFAGHQQLPQLGDVFRWQGWQAAVTARVWEESPGGWLLRLYMGNLHEASS